MELVIKKFNELTNKELYELLKTRFKIFVEEQKCIYPDLDDIDYISTHIFFKDEQGIVQAYLRLFTLDDPTCMHIGRVVTLVHGQGLGGKILHIGVEEAKKNTNIKSIYLEAQTYALGYYEKEGFKVISDEFILDGIPHKKMLLEIK